MGKVYLRVSDGAKSHPKLKQALYLFQTTLASEIDLITLVYSDDVVESYTIITYSEYLNETDIKRDINNKWYILFDNLLQAEMALSAEVPNGIEDHAVYKWSRFEDKELHNGYEVTSKGDRRFSPFYMITNHPTESNKKITIENYYQGYIKPIRLETGYDETEDMLPNVIGHYIFMEYPGLAFELAVIGKDKIFTDMFDVNGGQNKIYADLMNEFYGRYSK